LKKTWRVQYYFYPANNEKRKFVKVQNMNHIKNLKNRRILTQAIIDDIIDANKRGYHPILGKYVRVIDENAELNQFLDFITAFRLAVDKIRCSEKHRKQLVWAVKRLEKNVVKLNLHNVTIGNLTRRDFKRLL